MKRKWREIKALLGICAAFGWWGALYPELTLLPDTYRVVIVDDECPDEETGRLYKRLVEETGEWRIPGDVYLDILEADEERIVIKSKLWEDISALIEEWRNGK